MVDGEDDMEIMDGQDPFLLVFEPLRLLERAAFWAMTILAGLITEFPLPALLIVAPFQDAAECGSAAIQDGAHSFRLLIGKPMRLFIFADMFTEDVSQLETRAFGG